MKKKVLISVVIFLVLWAVGIRYLGKRLKENHVITYGIVTSITKGGNKGKRGPLITYRFDVNKKSITRTYRQRELKYSIDNFVGKTFPIAYGWNGLWYDDYILITPNDFNSFGYTFPDSLNWVLKFIEN